jgi:hypothetical protein
VRFQVLTATSMKMTVFWDVVPYSLIEIYRRFRGAYCLHHQGDDEATGVARASVCMKGIVMSRNKCTGELCVSISSRKIKSG